MEWMNVGGQLIPESEVDILIKNVKKGKLKSWDDVHGFYAEQSEKYAQQKLSHAFGCLKELEGTDIKKISETDFSELLNGAVKTREWMVQGIYDSRAKDYTNPFRKMVYESQEEMEAVTGKLEDNTFIQYQQEQFKIFKKQVAQVKKQLKMS